MKKTMIAAVVATAACGLMRRDTELPERTLTRELMFEVRADTINPETRTVELSFSSEEPYERWWGSEILDHGKSAVRLGRLNGGAAVLINHDVDDQVGVVEKAWLDGPKGRALVRFGKSPRADEVFQDVCDGIRKLVSVGYRIWELVLEKSSNDDDTYRVTDWEPYEISLVAVPADATVGVGRDGETPSFDPRSLIQEEEDMRPLNNHQRRDGAAGVSPVVAPTIPEGSVLLTNEARSAEIVAAREAERMRIATIGAMGVRLSATELAQKCIDEGKTVEEFVRDFEAKTGKAGAIRTAESPELGMSDREKQRYSFIRLLAALANPHDRASQERAAFEMECSVEAQKKAGGEKELRGFTVPIDVLTSPIDPNARRDLSVGTATAGGNLVATNLLTSSFIDLLRNRLALQGLGARMLTDLSGNLAIPRMSGGATAYWVAEAGAPTESQQAFDQVALTPKTLGAFTDIGRRLLIQSSLDVEGLVRQDLATVIALAIDLAGINGSGSSNQPRGILNTSGIGSEVGGTNGAAPVWDNIVNMETTAAAANADIGSLGYLTNPKVRGKLKRTQRFATTNGDPVWEKDNTMNGYRSVASNQVPSNLTKGTASGICSAIIFGNFADLLVGMWSGLDLMIDPYTSSTTGTVRVVALQDVDVAVRHPESFVAMVDALTT